MKKILVPTDFSEDAENALNFAIQFNEKIKGEIVLMHVLEIPAASVNYGGDITAATAEVVYRRELIDGISKNLHERADKVRAAGQEASIRTEFGSPYKSIGVEVEEEQADWVIMGSRGVSGLKEVFVGSNAEKVIRYSKCPVITIQEPCDLNSIGNMVFASDTRPNGDGVAAKAKAFQKMLGLKMHLLRVKTPYNFLDEGTAKEELGAFATRNELEDYTLNVREAEFADEGIVAFAEEINAGMIVMGTHGRTGLAHLLGGSQAEDVANHATMPVLTFRIES
jgi:nucleotide-binding universal stress UspA family protein